MIIAAGLGLYMVMVYNDLVSLRARIRAAIQEIGNQLKRQVELIPNLEQSVKGYLKHEKDVLKMLTDARKLVESGKDASNKIPEILSRLQVIVESNPQLKGADVVQDLMAELRDTSDKVMYSRRTLIDITADYNIKIASFPSSIVANMFSFKPEKGLETPETGAHLTVSDTETSTPRVKLD